MKNNQDKTLTELIYSEIKLHYNLKNDKELADFLGIKPQAISNSLARNQINWNNIITKCEDLSIDALLAKFTNSEKRRSLVMPTKRVMDIPLIPSGKIAEAFIDGPIPDIIDSTYYRIPLIRSAEFLLTFNGAMMLPTLAHGDILACRRMPDDTFFEWGEIYIIVTKQGTVIRRVREGKCGDTISLEADNPYYPAIEISRSNVQHIASLVGIVRSM